VLICRCLLAGVCERGGSGNHICVIMPPATVCVCVCVYNYLCVRVSICVPTFVSFCLVLCVFFDLYTCVCTFLRGNRFKQCVYLQIYHSNTQQHTATHCNTLQHTATHFKYRTNVETGKPGMPEI